MIGRSRPCGDSGRGSSCGWPEAEITLVCLKDKNKELTVSPILIGSMARMAICQGFFFLSGYPNLVYFLTIFAVQCDYMIKSQSMKCEHKS